jgi:hypothetical protein
MAFELRLLQVMILLFIFKLTPFKCQVRSEVPAEDRRYNTYLTSWSGLSHSLETFMDEYNSFMEARDNWSTRRIFCPSTTFSVANTTWITLGLKPVFRSEKQASNCLIVLARCLPWVSLLDHVSLNFSIARATSGSQDCYRHISFFVAQSSWNFKWCINKTTAGTGEMHKVCESHRSVTRFIQKSSEFFYIRVGWGSPVDHSTKFVPGKDYLGVNVFRLNVNVSFQIPTKSGIPKRHIILRSLIKLNATVTYWLLAGNSKKKVSLFYCFCGDILDFYRENLVALCGESCSSSREPGSDSCVQLYQWTHCIVRRIWKGNQTLIFVCRSYENRIRWLMSTMLDRTHWLGNPRT